MYDFPISVMMDAFRLSEDEAIKEVAAMGVQSFRMYATYGEHAPENMLPAKIRERILPPILRHRRGSVIAASSPLHWRG